MLAKVSTPNTPVQGSIAGDGKNDCSRRSQPCCDIPQFFIDDVSPTKRRWLAKAHIQLKKPKQVRPPGQVSTGECSPCTRLLTVEGLDDKNRPAPSVFSCAGSSESQVFSTPHLCQPTVRTDMSALRAQFGTEGIRIYNQLDCSMSKESRDTHSSLPGRLPLGKSKPNHVAPPCRYHTTVPNKPRLENKHKEVRPNAAEKTRIPRHNLGPLAEPKILAGKTHLKNTHPSDSFTSKKKSELENPTNTDRDDELRKFCCPKGASSLPCITSASKQTAKAWRTNYSSADGAEYIGTRLVATELPATLKNPQSKSDTLPHDRCKRHWVGGQARQRELSGHLVGGSNTSSLQSERNDSNNKRTEKSGPAPEFEFSPNSERQQIGCLIPSSRRGHEVGRTYPIDQGIIPDTGKIQHRYHDIPHTRGLQYRSRSPIASESATRMASTARSDADTVQEVGDTDGRPLCLTQSSCSYNILHDGQSGQRCSLLRCSEHAMEFSSSLGLPASTSRSEGPSSSEHGLRGVPPGGAKMGKCLLEARHKEQSTGRTIRNQRPTSCSSRRYDRPSSVEGDRNDPGSMEMWGWHKHLTDWSEEQRALLRSSWRESTLNTYRPAWKRWLTWSGNNGIDPCNPNGSELARFLADLHQKENLALSTILVHKSVVATFSSPANQDRLSSHSLVKHVLKSIALAKPKPTKPPIWDTDLLKDYLSNQNPETASLYETSQRTATILLLCSGRRVHDLTLLRVSVNHLVAEQNSIILYPVFGSKTDSCDHRQSGWKLTTYNTNKALCPVYWINRLLNLSRDRRNISTSDNLFITITGPPRAASRTIIGGWIKKLLREAGIEASAGSIRSAVASKSWIDNFRLDEILARGNWRSANTFKRFYRREIISTARNTASVTSSFTPVSD